MAVYQSGTPPIVREQRRDVLVSILMTHHMGSGTIKGMVRQQRKFFRIPRKAAWTCREDEFAPGNYKLSFTWYEVETNA